MQNGTPPVANTFSPNAPQQGSGPGGMNDPYAGLPPANISQTASNTNQGVSAPQTITPSDISGSATPQNFQSPAPTPILGAPQVPQLTPTAGEKTAQDTSTQLQQLNAELAGKGQYEINAAQSLGFGTITDANGNLQINDPAIQDLNNRLNVLATNAKSIPDQIMNAYAGRGGTTGGMDAVQTAALRQNAIEANLVSAALAGKQSSLATAQMYVNQAVTQKYAPIESQIKSLTANLQLIQTSPEYSLEQQNRAQQQQLLLNQQAAQLDLEKQNYLNAQTEALKYAPLASAQQLQLLQNAHSPAEVATLAAAMNLKQPAAGRYKDSITTTTDVFGNQNQTVRVFDTITGQFVNTPKGTTAAQLNAASNQPAGGGQITPTAPAATPTQITGSGPAKLDFGQYGLLANTDFNPNKGGQAGTVDSLAFNYLDNYLKNGVVPTASTLGRNMKPGGFAAVQQRARDLYYQATGTPLPNPEIIKGYQQQLIGNNNLLNNLKVQEGTIQANSDLLLKNLSAANLNQAAPIVNGIIDSIHNALGDPNTASFLAQNSTLQTELGSLLALKNAQGTTVHDKLMAAGLITSSYNAGQIANVVKQLMNEAANARGAIEAANGDLYKQIDPLMQDPNNPLRAQHNAVSSGNYPAQINYQGKLYNVDPKTGDLTPA